MRGNIVVGSDAPNSETPSTSSSLIEQAKQRDREAWERMAALYGPMVYSWCRRLHLPSEDAADTVQDVFMVVIDAIGGFRGGRKGAFRSWLRTITHNKIRDHFRLTTGVVHATGGSSAQQRLLQTTDSRVGGEDSLADDWPQSGASIWAYAIDRVRAEFPSHVWEAFWKSVVDGMPTREVAGQLNMSVAAVYQAKSRVLRRLRQDLRDLDLPD